MNKIELKLKMNQTKLIVGAAALLPLVVSNPLAAAGLDHFVYENKQEIASAGDFDGDGRLDAVIVDRASGKYRIGYQLSAGTITWASVRVSGVSNVTGFSVGKLLDPKKDALAFATADGSAVKVCDASNPQMAGRTYDVPLQCMGPNTVVAIDIGGAGNTPELDLYVGSIYNVDPQNLSTLFRNKAGKFEQTEEVGAPGVLNHAQRLALKEGGPEYVCAVMPGKGKDAFVVQDLASGKPVVVSTSDDLPAGAHFVAGNWSGKPTREILAYKPEDAQLQHRPVVEAGGKPALGKGQVFTMPKPITEVFNLGKNLLVVFGTNEPAAIYSFDGAKAPAEIQSVRGKAGEMVSGAFVLGDYVGVLYRAQVTRLKYSARFELFKPEGGKYVSSGSGELPTLDIGDAFIIPEIHRRIVENLKVKDEAGMQAYTRTIPGTAVSFTMLPIKGGEFTMGSPASEKGRKPDEGPQHKVKIEPFWMAKCETTWNEYEIFMFPDDEKKLRATYKSDPEVDKISDQVTRPSKPYVEMSFGMGKDGFPAIAMTQHGANKYCMWLSAKTGEFYRLPTEAEWEYACRAGTTTAYSFGDDESKLGEYAWYEKNSEENGDWKYHKVGLKKPNPWGLHDMHGNVAEWTLDQYVPNYDQFANGADNPWVKATKPYPHAARGGSYDFEAAACRSAARLASTPDWKAQDPQLPKSYWYFTDAKFIGFRLVRPLKVVSAEEIQRYWNSGVEKD